MFVVRVRVRGDSRLKLVGSVFKAIWQLRRSGFCLHPVLFLLSHTHSIAASARLSSPISLNMIRRNPTLIAMGDSDVQDVRNMIAKKQAEAIKSPNSTANANVKGKQGPPLQAPAAAVHVTDEAKWRREAREERLGITH